MAARAKSPEKKVYVERTYKPGDRAEWFVVVRVVNSTTTLPDEMLSQAELETLMETHTVVIDRHRSPR